MTPGQTMSATVFDTLAYAKKLKAAGVPDAQAEAQAQALAEAISTDLVTKDYLDARIADLRIDLIKWMVGIAITLAALLITILVKIQ